MGHPLRLYPRDLGFQEVFFGKENCRTYIRI